MSIFVRVSKKSRQRDIKHAEHFPLLSRLRHAPRRVSAEMVAGRHAPLVFAVAAAAVTAAAAGEVGKGYTSGEELLREKLFASGPKKALPKNATGSGSDPINVAVGLYFYALGDFNELSGTVQLSIWQRLSWKDPNVVWNPADYGGVNRLAISEEDIWVPDATIYNTVGITSEEVQPAHVGLYADGTVYWSRPGPLTIKCGASGKRGDRPKSDALAAELGGRHWPSVVDLSLFPFDKQRCEIVLASWFYPGSDVNLTLMSPGHPFNTSVSVDPVNGLAAESPEFKVHPIKAERVDKFYSCCPGEPFPTIHYYIIFERYYTDYVINILIPILITVLFGFFAFLIPPEFGERIGLGITCILTVMAVMFITTESLPTTKHITLLALYNIGALVFTGIPLLVSCIVGYLKALSVRDQSIQDASAEVLDRIWDLTEELAKDEGEMNERGKFLGEKLGNYLAKVAPNIVPTEDVVQKAALKETIMQEKKQEQGHKERGAGPTIGEAKEPSRSFRVKDAHKRMELRKSQYLAPSWEVLSEMIDRVCGEIIPLLYLLYLGVLGFALAREDKASMQYLPHFLWVGILVLSVRFLLHYRHWVKEQLIMEMLYSRDGIDNDINNADLSKYRQQFRCFDKDFNGHLSVQEMMEEFQKHGRVVRQKELMRRLNMADDNDDKEISFNDFVNLMEGLKTIRHAAEPTQRPRSTHLELWEEQVAMLEGNSNSAPMTSPMKVSSSASPATLRYRGAKEAKHLHDSTVRGDPLAGIVSQWSPKDVGEWIAELGYEEHVDAFVKNGVDGGTLRALTDADLRDSLGVAHLGQRKALARSIAALTGSGGGVGVRSQEQAILRENMQRLITERVPRKAPSSAGAGGSRLMSVISASVWIDKKKKKVAGGAARNYVAPEGTDEEAA